MADVNVVHVLDVNGSAIGGPTREISVCPKKSAIPACFAHHWQRVSIMLQSGR